MLGRYARFALATLFVLVAVTLAVTAPGQQPLAAQPPVARATIDPQPPMALSVEVVGLQKHARGGIASIALKVSADVGVDRAVVTAKAPGELMFADGSRVKTWNVDLEAGGVRTLAVDVLVPRDGRFTITAEVEGTVHGKSLRRGAAGSLLVGKHEAAPMVREGAIEYLAVEGAEVQP